MVSHVLMEDREDAESLLVDNLGAADYPKASVRRIRASLEDSFISMIEREDKRIADQGGRTR